MNRIVQLIQLDSITNKKELQWKWLNELSAKKKFQVQIIKTLVQLNVFCFKDRIYKSQTDSDFVQIICTEFKVLIALSNVSELFSVCIRLEI